MKRLIATLIMAVTALTAAAQEVRFNSDGRFKIVQLTDLHFKPSMPKEAEKTFARMDFIVREEKPDFIAITGDVIWGKPAEKMFQQILDTLDSYRIPFCLVLGNHDAEQLSRTRIAEMVTSAKYNVNTLNEKGELADIRIPVASSRGDDGAPLDLYFLDSNDYSRMKETVGGYGWFSLEQIIWLKGQCEAATAANGGAHVPSLAFFHIPFPEFYDAWIAAESVKHNSVTGIRGEYGGHPQVNSGMFTAMLETGNIMGVFCGHDHNSDYIVPYYGIALAYGRYCGDDTVYNNLPHGVRVIELKEGERAFRSWVHEDDGHIRQKVRFEDGKVSR